MAERLQHAPMTRLFEDARTTQEWQSRFGFFPVVQHGASSGPLSLMAQLLAHKENHPTATGVFKPESSNTCPKNQAEVDEYLRKKPEGGMPLGFPALSRADSGALLYWLQRGAPGPDAAALARLQRPSNGAAGEAILAKWESFLNRQDVKTRISARYIFEHLFLAHIRFDGIPGDFFRLVRSRTPSGAVDEIATRRPYDDPGRAFHYRFRRISGSLVRKTHIPYHLNDAKMQRYRDLFLNPSWSNAAPAYPSWKVDVAANAFVAFKDMPARSRYQFLLDDAFFHVMTFIRGPVCKGHTALNVIDAHFYIMFINPDSDLTVTRPDFLPSVTRYLKLPAQGGEGVKAFYARFKYDQLKYLKARQSLYKKHGSQGRALADIWDGGGFNDNAILTVHRHDESADVMKGAHGGLPKTTWLMDYPIFERIYYDLVAGFDVFGNLVHQLSTRMYMDNLRVESEDEFLNFLPAKERKKIRKSWYRGSLASAAMALFDPLYEQHIETRVRYRDPANAKQEFLAQVFNARLGPRVRGPPDAINGRPGQGPVAAAAGSAEPALARLVKRTGSFTQSLPEVSFVRVGDKAYTLIHNRAYKNVRFIFSGDHYREPSADELHVLRGFQGSHPNFFFDVPRARLDEFVKGILDGSFKRVVDTFGVRRMNPRFWELADWFNDKYRHESPNEAGVFDLMRYENY